MAGVPKRFSGRTLVIATMHGKERAIAPVLESSLGVRCVTTDRLDTDALGTFTGEIERRLDPLSTAREKCHRAMDLTGCDLAVANEGSFGPHPTAYFVTADDEIMLLVDRRNGREYVAREVSTETNFSTQIVRDPTELSAFAERAGFPAHGLILRHSRTDSVDMHKGIVDQVELSTVFSSLAARYGEVCVETDMRAHFNPSRMLVIEAAAHKLASILISTCPSCHAPGFAVKDVKRGLPCGACGLPTEGVSRHIYRCEECGHQHEARNPTGKTYEDPMYCQYCNP